MQTIPSISEVENALRNPNQETLQAAYPTYQPPSNNGSAISLDQLATETPITVPAPIATPNPLTSVAAGAQATSQSITDAIAQSQPQTETRNQYDSILADVQSLLPGTTGRGQDQLNAEQAAGIPQQNQELAGLNAEILKAVAEANKRNAEYEKEIARLETQPGMLTSISLGQQGAVRKLQLAEANSKSADIMLLEARAQGLAGRINAAQRGVDRAIDLKYADRESQLNVKMEQLKLLEGKLNKEEQIVAKALDRKYNEEREKIAEEKAKAKENINLAFSANVQTKYANKGGEWFRVSDGKTFATPEELFKDAGIKSFDQLYKTGQVTDLNAERVADLDFVSQLRAKYPDAGITINDSSASASQKLNNSRIYREQVRPPASAGGSSSGGILGLTNQQIDNISPLVTQYQNNDIVKNYTTIGTTLNAVRSLGSTPTDDIQRIYAFAKIMDPTSVVREGEYKTIQDYSAAVLQRAGLNAKRVFTNAGFLTNEARGFLLNTLENNFKSAETTYKQLTSETSRRINLIGNTDKGDQLLNNYGGAFTPPGQSNNITVPIAQIKAMYTPQIVNELRAKAKSKGYNDRDLQEMVDFGYTPDQMRELLK